MTQRIAIMGGMDWADASVDFVNLPDEADLNKLYEEYKNFGEEVKSAQRAWFERNPNHRLGQPTPENDPYPSYVDFITWLREHSLGATSDVIEWWEPRY